MAKAKVLLQGKVPEEWIDYNGHMNDAEYVRAFSWAVEKFMQLIGFNEEFIVETKHTIYTLENHVCYLNEMKLDEPFEIHVQMLDYDEKRTHVFFELYGENGKRAATSEQMLMGIDQTTGRAGSFPTEILATVKEFSNAYTLDIKPKEVGRVIGI